MRRMTSNRLLVGAGAFLGAYFLLAITPFWSGSVNAVISGLLLVWGAFVMVSWGRDAYQVFKSGVVEGPQLALVGVTIVAAGSVYSGAFGVAWAIAQEPQSWLGTPFSAFGRYIMAIGFALQWFSPEVEGDRTRPPRWWYFVGFVIFVALAAFALGTKWGDAKTADVSQRVVENRTLTATNCPVMGNVRRDGERIYHDQTSPYRAMVHPEACFDTVEEARVAGYRAPR